MTHIDGRKVRKADFPNVTAETRRLYRERMERVAHAAWHAYTEEFADAWVDPQAEDPLATKIFADHLAPLLLPFPNLDHLDEKTRRRWEAKVTRVAIATMRASSKEFAGEGKGPYWPKKCDGNFDWHKIQDRSPEERLRELRKKKAKRGANGKAKRARA
jgi:hypothetical protein